MVKTMANRGTPEVNRMKIFFHTPMPPVRSGIADYSVELLEELALKADMTVVHHEDSHCEVEPHDNYSTISGYEWEAKRSEVADAVNVYQIGNNSEFFSYIFDRALKTPGVVILHDVSLIGLLTNGRQEYLDRFTEYELGQVANKWLRARREFDLFEWQDFLVRGLGLLVDSAQCIIVHSEYARRLLARRYKARSVLTMRHHLSRSFVGESTPAIGRYDIRRFLAKNDGSVRVGTFGYLTPPKRIDWLIKGFKLALDNGVNASLILCGEPHGDTQIPTLLETVPKDKVFVTGFLAEQDMRALMARVDLQINLRFPSVGESSGTLTRALGMAVPCVILDYEAFSDYSSDYVTKIALDGNVAESVANVISDFEAEPTAFYNRAKRARDWIVSEAKVESSAEVVLSACEAQTVSSIRLSNLFQNLGADLGKVLPTQIIEMPTHERKPFGETICNVVLEGAGFLDAVYGARSDVVSLGEVDLERRVIFNFEEARTGARRVFLASLSAEYSSDEIIDFFTSFELQRFDVVILIPLTLRLKQSRPSITNWVEETHGGGLHGNEWIVRCRRDIDVGSERLCAIIFEVLR
jgi:glycosyltransferase involved in cell wall biosynthesis